MKSCSVIVVDSDVRVLDQVSAVLDGMVTVLATSEARRVGPWLRNDPTIYAILVSQSLRGVSGLELLEEAQQLRPEVRRILIADYENLATIISGLHSGVVQRTISRPIDPRELVGAMRTAPLVARPVGAGEPAALQA